MTQTEIKTLNQQTAYTKNQPITSPQDMPRPIICGKMDEEWLNRTQDLFWATHFKGDVTKLEPILQDMLHMRDFILTFGGDQVCMPFIEGDIEKIMNRGQLWYGDRIDMKIGEKRECHRNSGTLWKQNRQEKNGPYF